MSSSLLAIHKREFAYLPYIYRFFECYTFQLSNSHEFFSMLLTQLKFFSLTSRLLHHRTTTFFTVKMLVSVIFRYMYCHIRTAVKTFCFLCKRLCIVLYISQNLLCIIIFSPHITLVLDLLNQFLLLNLFLHSAPPSSSSGLSNVFPHTSYVSVSKSLMYSRSTHPG